MHVFGHQHAEQSASCRQLSLGSSELVCLVHGHSLLKEGQDVLLFGQHALSFYFFFFLLVSRNEPATFQGEPTRASLKRLFFSQESPAFSHREQFTLATWLNFLLCWGATLGG